MTFNIQVANEGPFGFIVSSMIVVIVPLYCVPLQQVCSPGHPAGA